MIELTATSTSTSVCLGKPKRNTLTQSLTAVTAVLWTPTQDPQLAKSEKELLPLPPTNFKVVI
jgi:hypothetical protein